MPAAYRRCRSRSRCFEQSEIVSLPTLRRELVSAFALVFASALAIVWAGLLWIGSSTDPRTAAVYGMLLVLAAVAAFTLFGRYWLQRRLVTPLEQVIERVEAVARGDSSVRLTGGGTEELARLAAAVDHMAARLIVGQRELAANIRSLEETNQMLTEAEDAMVHAEKMASVGRLGAGVAHEVGNPLGAILGYLGILGRHVKGGDLELVRAAELEAQRIDRIVSGLLDYSRPRESRSQPTDVNALVRESLELLGMQGRFSALELRHQLQDGLPPVLADPFQLQQVLFNLFMNATDALGDTVRPWLMVKTAMLAYAAPAQLPARRKDDPPGVDYSHRRRLRGRAAPEDPITGGAIAPTPRDIRRAGVPIVEIVVADNGPGVAPEMIEQIFEPFVTTKEPGRGSGLGLAVCARLVDAMGGSIRADSRTGEGARFTVLLPALVPGQRLDPEAAHLPRVDA